ncbi:hypothetical protein L6452_29922 [Arctium lappa]|uniref:Uncharacterized protein n=1 Tax=Arctium lappa TaxID=4217 RepID=A0ACB8ZHQ0_ARCLA|nr:hypothetical protein L6452_29922 [Arctium lappa]
MISDPSPFYGESSTFSHAPQYGVVHTLDATYKDDMDLSFATIIHRTTSRSRPHLLSSGLQSLRQRINLII